MNFMKFSAISIAVFMCVSCSQKIDCSTDEAMKLSIKEINESLNEEEKVEFSEALKLVMFSKVDLKQMIANGKDDNTVNDIKSKLDGKTASDIIEEANQIKAKMEE